METAEEWMNRVACDVPEETLEPYFDAGCIDYTDRFGVVPTVDGYTIFLNADGTHFFWVRNEDGLEGVIFSNRFDALRSAKNHKKGLER